MTPHAHPLRRSGECGFTLLELIVVIAIVSLVLVAVTPLANPWGGGALLDVAAREMAIALRETRSAAIYRNGGTTFTLDGAAGQYWSDAMSTPRALPARVSATFAGQTPSGQIQFFPDGGASGGAIVLSDAHRSAAIRVEALTGRVKINVSR